MPPGDEVVGTEEGAFGVASFGDSRLCDLGDISLEDGAVVVGERVECPVWQVHRPRQECRHLTAGDQVVGAEQGAFRVAALRHLLFDEPFDVGLERMAVGIGEAADLNGDCAGNVNNGRGHSVINGGCSAHRQCHLVGPRGVERDRCPPVDPPACETSLRSGAEGYLAYGHKVRRIDRIAPFDLRPTRSGT